VSAPTQLGETTETLFRAVAAVADALYVVDSAGRIAFLNPAALTILGYTEERQLLGKPSHATIHHLRPDGSPFPEEECPLLRPLRNGTTVRIERDWFVRRDGSCVPVAYSSAPVELEDGRGAVVSFRDLSERLRLGEVEASRARIARAAYAARRAIQRDLHDGAQQQFVAVALQLANARESIGAQSTEAGLLVADALANLEDAIEELRRLAHGIHPAELSESGLGAALGTLAQRSPIPVEVSVDHPGRMAPEIESAAYFIATEATTNAVKHAGASHIEISVACARNELRVTVTDDGAGGASLETSGLQGLRDRAEAIGGNLAIDSPGGGPTSLVATLPLFRARRAASLRDSPLRVVLADDAAVVRQGLAELLSHSGIDVVAQVGDAPALLEEVERHSPDIAVVDIHMPPTQTQEGVRAAIEIRGRFPGVGILLLSSYVEPTEAIGLFTATAASGIGYLLKDSVVDVDQLLDALERISEGEIVLEPRLVVDLLLRGEQPEPLHALSSREREVLALMAEGRSNAGIARALWLAEGTVEKHVRQIFKKLGLPDAPDDHRRVLAVIAFLESRPGETYGTQP
jgi:PAS domain S-box-containing protein